MNVTVNQLDALTRQVEIHVDENLVSRDVDKKLKEISGRVRIDGFRPGKAPVGEVKRRYGQGARLEAIDGIVQRAMMEVLRREDLAGAVHVTQPELTAGVTAGQGVSFRFFAESYPTFTPAGFTGLQLKRARAEVADAEVDAEIERLRRERSTIEPVEGRTSASRGDVMELDFNPRGTGAVEQLKADGQLLDTSDPSVVPGLVDQLDGIELGQTRTVTLNLPESFAAPDLAGQTIELDITLKGVRARVLPALDDEFAKDTGRGDSLDALRSAISAEMREARARNAEQAMRRSALTAIVAANPIELPKRYLDSLAEREARARLEAMAQRFGQKLPQNDAVDPELVDAVRPMVKTVLEEAVVLDAIAAAQAIAVTTEDIDAHVEKVAAERKLPAARVRASLSRDDGLNRLRTSLRRERALDFVIAGSTIEEVEPSAEAE